MSGRAWQGQCGLGRMCIMFAIMGTDTRLHVHLSSQETSLSL